MKIGKVSKTETITNPFRKRPPFLRSYTTCRITENSTLSQDSNVYTLQIDCDEVKDFWNNVLNIPNPQRYYDDIYEIWFTTNEWKTKVIEWALLYFDEVKVVHSDGKIDTLKKYEKDKNGDAGRH